MPITLDGTSGIITPGLINTGSETVINLTTSGNTILGDASTDTLNVGNGGLIKDASGNLLVNTSTAVTYIIANDGAMTSVPKLEVASTDANAAASIIRYSNDATGSNLFIGKSRGTTANSKTVVQAGDQLGSLSFFGTDGDEFQTASSIASFVNTASNNAVSADLRFYTTPTGAYVGVERMRLDTSGNLGLGVTPSAWASTVKAIEFGSWGAVGSSGTSGNAEYLNNAIQSTNGGAFVYKNNGPATKYTQALGTQSWSYAPSGTAGNAITFSQAMTLDATSSLFVGAKIWAGGNSRGETNTYLNAPLGGIGGVAGSGTGALNTGININQGNGGATALLLASRNTGAGTATDSAVYIVRFFYDGNNAPSLTYIGGSSNFVTSSIVGSYWYLTNSGNGNHNYSWFVNK